MADIMENFEIAVVDENTLACVGLRIILQDILPGIVIRTFDSFEQFEADKNDRFIHFFVSFRIYMEHNAYFLPRQMRTIVMSTESQLAQMTGVRVLDVNQPEEELVRRLLVLQNNGHRKHPTDERIPHWDIAKPVLSQREAEVLVLVVKGNINKEIAEQLHISVSTVISHRKNITEKLQIKSVSKLTIYAVMNGYVEADKI
jgi:DNA-binding CsgD family transcriptional regulator